MDAPVYKKLMDIESQQENPFNTAFGQKIVAIEENFWSRMLRYGRSAYKTWFEITLGAAGSLNTQTQFTPSAQTTFIPKVLTVSASVDCLMYVMYLPASNYNVFENVLSTTQEVYAVFRVMANTPFALYFDGDLQVSDGGNISITVKPLTVANGVFDGCLHGVEVSNRA